MFSDATTDQLDQVMKNAWAAFNIYRQCSLKERGSLLRSIAAQVELLGERLAVLAAAETNLPEARLKGEIARTIFQLNSYADACEKGNWLEARIDTAIPEKTPPKPDIRKMLIPLGPVVVFGASNFPFAYSTAGGDMASALAAGCPVVVKAHPAHPQTSGLVATAIKKAVAESGLPEAVFSHVYGSSFSVGKTLVEHPYTKAVGFTGSFTGGKQLFDWANARKEPIPVFAEMSSTNPVFLLPEKMSIAAVETAKAYAGSITLGAGQFCTNPGLLIGQESADLEQFAQALANEIKQIPPAIMLHTGISHNYSTKRTEALSQPGVTIVSVSETEAGENQGAPTIASVTAEAFIDNPRLREEVFGPYSLLVRCKDPQQMIEVAKHAGGQLTATLMATDNDIRNNEALVEEVKNLCGRLIVNGVPTGVEVCLSMQHGGPFPSTTDSRFTSVGADAIKRFARPVAFQNWSNDLLPDELKNENPLSIWRTVNNELSNAAIK